MAKKYEISLTPREQRAALVSMLESVGVSARQIREHRTMGRGEKAGALASLLIKAVALEMAIDRLEERKKSAAA